MKFKHILLLAMLAISVTVLAVTLPNYSKMHPPIQLTPGADYALEWRKVDSLDRAGLPESARDLVKLIDARATKEENGLQSIKCFIFLNKYDAALEEHAWDSISHRFDVYLKKSKFPETQILYSLRATNYWNYYQNNRYSMYGRTPVTGDPGNDIETWDLRTLVNKTLECVRLSIEPSEDLASSNVEYAEVLLNGVPASRNLRPSLYDLLAYRALAILENDASDLPQPSWKFEINDARAIAPADAFIKWTPETKDSLSHAFLSLEIYRKLIAQHKARNETAAWVDADLKRLQYVKNKGILEDKDAVYRKRLEELVSQLKNDPIVLKPVAALIGDYLSEVSDEIPMPEDKVNNRKKALELVTEYGDKFPESPDNKTIWYYGTDIRLKYLGFTHENVIYPGKQAPVHLNYRNLDKVWVRIAQCNNDKYADILSGKSDEYPGKFAALPVVGTDRLLQLPGSEDFNTHSLLFDLPMLPEGSYVILAGSSPQFADGTEGFTHSLLHVSKMGYTVQGISGKDQEIQVFDRESGKPMADVKVSINEYKYNYTTRKYETKLVRTVNTNASGSASIAMEDKNYRQYSLVLSKGKDVLDAGDQISTWNANERSKQTRTFYFLDRMIYRPGQTVFFKGITLELNGDKNSVKTGLKQTVTFRDANYQEVAKQTFTTNDYGSFQGSFTVPLGGLTGQMSLSTDYGDVYFSVEEYKRPKFEATFEPVKGSYRLGDQIKVKGNAKAYAGSNIDGAKVQYRVVRQARFPWWCSWWWRPMPRSSSLEISHGEVETDGEGNFEIQFTAIPDKSISDKDLPEFSYLVTADVTDITGETHSTQTSVQVGLIALKLNVGIPTNWRKSNGEVVKISTKNLNGSPEPAKGTISVMKLAPQKVVYRTRIFPVCDQSILPESEFHQKFPHDLYAHENELSSRKRLNEVLKVNFDTGNADSVLFSGLKNWEEGGYVAIVKTTDKFGTPVEIERYFSVYDPEVKTYKAKELFETELLKSSYEPGETAQIAIWSGDDALQVRYDFEVKGKIIKSEWVTLSHEKKILSFPIEESYRGNVFVHFLGFRRGQAINESTAIAVPWSNKNLKIEFETFRDKLAPGAAEEWRLKITGPDAEPVAAEMVAGMYDASLDVFRTNSWSLPIWESRWQTYSQRTYWSHSTTTGQAWQPNWYNKLSPHYQEYDNLNMFGWYYASFSGRDRFYYRSEGLESDGDIMEEIAVGNASTRVPMDAMAKVQEKSESPQNGVLKESNNQATTISTGEQQKVSGGEGKDAGMGEVNVRTNLNETAFFYPQMMTNEKGEIIVSFTVPEALTRWKIMTLAHTKDLKTGFAENSLVTQKDLMVMPSPPRFFREGDKMTFTAKVSNLSEQNLSGNAVLELIDAVTMKPVNAAFGLPNSQIPFSVEKGRSAPLAWEITVPEGISAVTFRVKAKAGNFTDGEESSLPVLTNRMLVTESMPLPMRGNQTRSFVFKKLAENKSTTLKNHSYTLEFTSSPVWYAVQALPYMMEYPYECTEQTFNRYYANSLATFVANSNPRFKQIFEQWKTQGPEALLSNLEKNQELKSLLLEETPWVMEAKDESERKKRMGLLFDLNRMANEQAIALKKLKNAQTPNGGFTWFPGMQDSPYITQYVVIGFAHLHKLGVIDIARQNDIRKMMESAVNYTDDRMNEAYQNVLKYNKKPEEYHVGVNEALYLYGRTMLTDIPVASRNKVAFDFYVKQAEKYVLQDGHYQKGLIALALYRINPKSTTPGKALKSLRETAVKNDEMGMYWKSESGWFWYQAPIETHALLIEAFQEIENDQKTVDELRLWLLKQKQVQDWKTTKATAEACYALLIGGDSWLEEAQLPQISLGGQQLDIMARQDVKVQAGTGYFRTVWSGSEVTKEMAEVKVTNPNKGPAWGAVYWQYFEQLDKITPAETPLKLKKELFLQKNTDRGPELTAISPTTKLQPGDLIKVRIELRVDRSMEYVHMKDMRAAGFEPVNVLSRYKWQDGLGYYENTRDASTNFFMDWLPKGTYVFEYPLRVTYAGDFSNGITTIQSMYAPEFTSHSEGIRVKIGK